MGGTLLGLNLGNFPITRRHRLPTSCIDDHPPPGQTCMIPGNGLKMVQFNSCPLCGGGKKRRQNGIHLNNDRRLVHSYEVYRSTGAAGLSTRGLPIPGIGI